MEPYRLPAVVDDQRCVFAGGARPGFFLRGDEDVTGAVARACVLTSTTGGRNSGRERKAHGCSPRAGEAIALARGLGSQPRVPVSVIQAPPAATASRNLRRVIPVLNPLCLPLYRVQP